VSDFLKAVVLGIVEGLTEFVPVSSTGHLIIVGDWMSFTSANTATFDIAIQLGAIMAVVFLYKSFFWELLRPSQWLRHDMKCIVVAILPAFVMGALLHGTIKRYLFTSQTVAIGLFVGAIVMIVADRWVLNHPVKTESISRISYRQALIIGICQCAALWPGFSRSGATIVGGLFVGLGYQSAAKFSFIIAVPVMIAAVGFDLFKSSAALTMHDMQLIAVGFLISFVVAYAGIKIFLKVLCRVKLVPFAIYRIVLSVAILLT